VGWGLLIAFVIGTFTLLALTSPRRKGRRRLGLEALGVRIVPAGNTLHWIGPAGGNWNVAANWAENQIPVAGNGDTLVFDDVAGQAANTNSTDNIADLTIANSGIQESDDFGATWRSIAANLPLDGYVRLHGLGGADGFDRGGELASRGRADPALLARMLEHPYFAAPAPKSAGREEFGDPFVRTWQARLDMLSPEDALATLAALTVESVAHAIRTAAPGAAAMIASGGGVHNAALMDGLAAALPGMRIERSDAYGMNSDAKEAILFAVLGHALACERPANVPRVTGASGPRVLGGLAPFGLERLAAAVRREETT